MRHRHGGDINSIASACERCSGDYVSWLMARRYHKTVAFLYEAKEFFVRLQLYHSAVEFIEFVGDGKFYTMSNQHIQKEVWLIGFLDFHRQAC